VNRDIAVMPHQTSPDPRRTVRADDPQRTSGTTIEHRAFFWRPD
jgi:hypothetical protein